LRVSDTNGGKQDQNQVKTEFTTKRSIRNNPIEQGITVRFAAGIFLLRIGEVISKSDILKSAQVSYKFHEFKYYFHIIQISYTAGIRFFSKSGSRNAALISFTQVLSLLKSITSSALKPRAFGEK
jgi:hypothetical protein